MENISTQMYIHADGPGNNDCTTFFFYTDIYYGATL